MYTDENYLWGLVAYGVGVVCLMPLMYQVSRIVYWRFVKLLFWLTSLVVLLTPIKAYPDKQYLAPAWVVAAFEFVKKASPEGPARAITPIVVGMLGAVLLSIAIVILTRFWSRRKEKPEEA